MGNRDTLELSGVPLEFEPMNEQGVVFLFSQLARAHFGLKVVSIGRGFPDCIAQSGRKRIRIEFEFRSKNFDHHGHDPDKCDWIACWIHDWVESPPRLKIIDLRREFGLGFNVWVVPIGEPYRELISSAKDGDDWSVPKSAREADLVLYYRISPDKYIGDIFEIKNPREFGQVPWKKGNEWLAKVYRVAHLSQPVTLNQLREHPVLSNKGMVKASFRGRMNITDYWPSLHKLIVRQNPHIREELSRFEI